MPSHLHHALGRSIWGYLKWRQAATTSGGHSVSRLNSFGVVHSRTLACIIGRPYRAHSAHTARDGARQLIRECLSTEHLSRSIIFGMMIGSALRNSVSNLHFGRPLAEFDHGRASATRRFWRRRTSSRGGPPEPHDGGRPMTVHGYDYWTTPLLRDGCTICTAISTLK